MRYQKINFIFIVLLLSSCTTNNFDGNVYDYDTEQPIKNVYVNINGNKTETDSAGYFNIKMRVSPKYTIVLKKEGYASKRIFRGRDSLGRLSNKMKNNKIYLITVESDFTNKSK